MDKETTKATKGSIKKWDDIAAGTEIDRGHANCPLCQKFPSCDGCPVRLKTGQRSCGGSPYEEWTRHVLEFHKFYKPIPNGGDCSTCKELAEKEVEFLRGLLPTEQETTK